MSYRRCKISFASPVFFVQISHIFYNGDIMYRIRFIFIFVILFVMSGNSAYAISAKSYAVMEMTSNDVLLSKDAHTKLPMASTTKIMTALCAIENGDMDSVVEVSDKAIGVEGSSMYLERGEKLTLRNLLYGLMLNSGNDAAVAIAIHISGDVESFIKIMNDTAAKIGAKNTHFTNPNGLPDDNHYTTAYDLALITCYAYKYDDFREIVATYEKNIPWQGREYDRRLKNHNKLLTMYEGCTGVKTGFTKKSGRCLVSGAKRNGAEVICVTLNAPDDWNDHMTLMDSVFPRLSVKKLFRKGDYIATVTVKDGEGDRVGVVVKEDIDMVITDGKIPSVNVVTEIPDTITAPSGFEETVGEICVYHGNRLVGKTSLVTKEMIRQKEKPHIWQSVYNVLKAFIAGNE